MPVGQPGHPLPQAVVPPAHEHGRETPVAGNRLPGRIQVTDAPGTGYYQHGLLIRRQPRRPAGVLAGR